MSLGFACGLVLCVPSRDARASEAPGGELLVTRSLEAGDCPDDQALLAATLALGTTTPDPSAEAIRVEVSFTRDLDGYAATIRSSGRKQGVRELARADTSCAPLGDATALVVAVLFDLAPREEPAPAPAPSPPKDPEAKAPPPVASERERVPTKTSTGTTPFSIGFGIYGGAAYGLVGAVGTVSVAAAARPRWGRFELGVGALFVPPRSFAHGVGFVDVTLLTGRLEGCYWLTPLGTALGAGACGGLMIGGLYGEARGDYYRTDSDTHFWIAAEAAGIARFELGGPLALRFGLSLVVPTQKGHTFSFTDTGVAFETAPAAILAELGPEVRFP